MIKKIILWILVIFWMSLIFYFSSLNSTESSKQSKGFIYNTIVNIINFFDEDMNENEKEVIINKLNPIVRKLAHAAIYFILGLLVYLLVNEYIIVNKKVLIISLIVCLLYSISDEVHQLFVRGRSGEIRDILIDCLGYSTSIIIMHLLNRKKVISND